MRVRFLNKQEAVKEFDSSGYLKSHGVDEMRVKLTRYCGSYDAGPLYPQLLKCYESKITEFSEIEKNLIKFYFKKIYAHLRRKKPWLLPRRQTVGLIRLTGGIDWNAPFTLNHSMVLSDLVLQRMAYGCAGSLKSARYSLTTLCHEFTHLIQRYPELYPMQNEIFNNTYKKWGFIRIDPEQLDWNQVDMRNLPPLRTNPDGDSFQWIFPLRNTFYLPTLSEIDGTDAKSGRMIGVLIRLEKKDNRFLVTNDWDYTKNFPDYLKLFYNRDEQLYHPNEIMAVHLCDVLM